MSPLPELPKSKIRLWANTSVLVIGTNAIRDHLKVLKYKKAEPHEDPRYTMILPFERLGLGKRTVLTNLLVNLATCLWRSMVYMWRDIPSENGLVRMIFCEYLKGTYTASGTAGGCDSYFHTQVIKDSKVTEIPTFHLFHSIQEFLARRGAWDVPLFQFLTLE